MVEFHLPFYFKSLLTEGATTRAAFRTLGLLFVRKSAQCGGG